MSSAPDRSRLRTLLTRAVDEGREIALDFFRTELTAETKADKLDLVTQADIEVQEAIVDVLREAGLDATIVGEEGGAQKTIPGSGPAWVIDPIDGTNNFARGNRLWGISVAYLVDGDPELSTTALPALGDFYLADSEARVGAERDGTPIAVSESTDPETFTAVPVFGLKRADRPDYERVSKNILEALGDIRRYGTAQTALAMLASGELDAAVSTVTLSPWDTIAGVHLVRQAGGTVTDIHGDRWRHDSEGLVASNGTRHEAVLELVE